MNDLTYKSKIRKASNYIIERRSDTGYNDRIITENHYVIKTTKY
jgi:hypothetical protein